MKQPLEFYTQQKATFELEMAQLKKKLTISSWLRFTTFLSLVLGIYLFFGNLPVILGLLGIAIFIFVYLIFKHSDLQYQFDLKKVLVEINTTEISVLNRNYFHLEDGREFINSKHPYSFDIDLFGHGSFFQYSNRTVTLEGKNKLFEALTSNAIVSIEEKQEAIKELSEKPSWRHHFSAVASLVKVQHSAKEIVTWIHNYTSVFPKFIAYFPTGFSIISIGIIVSIGFRLIPDVLLLLWFILGLVISGFYLKKVNDLYNNACNAKDTFRQYHKLLVEIENTTFTTKILKKKQLDIQSETEKASVIFKKYSKLLDALDQRNNILIAVVGNGLFLRDVQQAFQIEKWIETYKNSVEEWFKVIAFFDAQNSLANFHFNHPTYVFPKINSTNKVMNASNLGHPLLKEKNRVDNNFNIKNQQFFIITGANMAGKSTFLRTVSLSIVMANMGLPVCAERFDYFPIKLITSMRTWIHWRMMNRISFQN